MSSRKEIQCCENSYESLMETSDSLLQQNADFVSLVQVLRRLQQQKQKVTSDLEELKQTKKEAIKNPMAFVEQLKHKERSFPQQQQVVAVPEINLELYSMFMSSELEDCGEWTIQETEELETMFFTHLSESKSVLWRIIADQLGKTPEQVEIRAEQLDLVPSSSKKRRRKETDAVSSPNKKRKLNSPTTKQLLRDQSKEMYSDDETSSLGSPFSDFASHNSFLESFEEETIGQSSFADPCNMAFTIHNGSKCKGCGMEPIRGPRWVCHDCCDTDLCETCYHSAWESSTHKHTHRLSKADMPIHLSADQYLPMHLEFAEESFDSPLTPDTESPLMSPLFDEDDHMHPSTSLFDIADVQLASSSFA